MTLRVMIRHFINETSIYLPDTLIKKHIIMKVLLKMRMILSK